MYKWENTSQMYWENTYQLPFLCTTETKSRVFQFKFTYRRIATNDFLLKIGKTEQTSVLFALIPERHLVYASVLGL